MSSEVFYDSLEGEHSSPPDSPSDNTVSSVVTGNDKLIVNENKVLNLSSNSCVLVIKYPPNHSSQCSRKSSNSSIRSEFEQNCSLNSGRLDHPRDISTLVPLYSGDIDKFCMKCRKCSSTPSPKAKDADCLVSDEKVSGSCKTCQTSKKKLIKCRNTKVPSKDSEIIIPEVRSRSYLRMFHRSIGYPGQTPKIGTNDTQRSIFGDSKRSSISLSSNENEQFRDAEDCQSDTTSFYMKAISESNHQKMGSGDAKHSPTIVAPPPSSTSELFSCTTPTNSTRSTYKSKRRINKLYPIPDLGGLGADTARFKDKMELRKRQLQYGQRASNRNRIKLKELDILKNLKNEIAESNAINNKNVQ